MRYLFINTVADYGSTGTIVMQNAERLIQEGHEICIAYGRGDPDRRDGVQYIKIGNSLSVNAHSLKARLLDRGGFGSRSATLRFVRQAEQYAPDVIWLHNLHGYYLDIRVLFRWLKAHPERKVRWTLHDCWAFTGHCSHFSFIDCRKWQTQCRRCPQTKRYPKSILLDNSRRNFDDKKRAFLGVADMTLHPVSHWLEDLVKKSFLGGYPIEVMYNEVNKEIFRPRESDFRSRYGLEDKRVILGVAGKWNDRKGLYDFYTLAEKLPGEYRVALAGLNARQLEALPSGIVGIAEVNDPIRLAEIYTAADLYVNLSRQETFGMTTLEAVCCGTQAIVLRGTACEEIALQHDGIVVDPSVDAVIRAIEDYFRNESTNA